MNNPTTTITLESDRCTVTNIDQHGVISTKNTSVEEIQSIFMKQQALETPLLPSQWGVAKYYRKNHYEGYVLTTPPAEREIQFDGLRNVPSIPPQALIPIPPMVWFMEIFDNEGRKTLNHSMLYVLKHELISLKDKVYHAPFPNVGTNHGICWGHGNTPKVPASKSIQQVPAQYFAQPFNGDLSRNRVKEFEFTHTSGEKEKTDGAIYHMVELSRKLAESKEAGKPFIYPFETLKTSSMSVEQAARSSMPGIFR